MVRIENEQQREVSLLRLCGPELRLERKKMSEGAICSYDSSFRASLSISSDFVVLSRLDVLMFTARDNSQILLRSNCLL